MRGRQLALTAREYDLLVYLMQNPASSCRARRCCSTCGVGISAAEAARWTPTCFRFGQKLGEHADLIETVRGWVSLGDRARRGRIRAFFGRNEPSMIYYVEDDQHSRSRHLRAQAGGFRGSGLSRCRRVLSACKTRFPTVLLDIMLPDRRA